ncbi:MAG: aldo/keto reductase, partial [Myxococcaceae bacterium]|nr:aldo/keto reductase [Myxococcaceae bacterium]
HIDTAEFYQNEDGVGAGLRAANLERKDVFITTKLWPGNAAWGQTPKTFETTIAALSQSLAKLKLDYVDLYLIHAPFEKEQRLAQWRALVELKKQGKTRSIGVSNFNVSHLEELKAAGLPQPEANQIELHPWSQKPELVGYLEKNGIVPIAYSSLVPLSTWRTAPGHASGKTAAMQKDSESSPFKALGEKYKKTESQVLLRWAVQKGWPVLPKSTKPERIKENADVFSFALDDADMASIAKMDRGDGIAWGSSDPVKAK